MDGQPFVIRSGEMHYPRVPRECWGHRLKMIRALGLNTVSTYVFWSEHEPQPGQFDFTGNLDVGEFCRLAQSESPVSGSSPSAHQLPVAGRRLPR